MLGASLFFFSPASKGEILSFSYSWCSMVSFNIFKNYYCRITELIARSTIELGTSVALATGTIPRVFIQSHLFHLADMIFGASNLPCLIQTER